MVSTPLLAILSLSLEFTSSMETNLVLRGMTPCERRRWHINIEHTAKPGCSNSWKVPSSWSIDPHIESKMFYETSDECCHGLFENGECNLHDFCECQEKAEDGTCALEAQNLSTTDENECDDNPKWHLDWDTKEGCTNSPRFPKEWENDPVVAEIMLFDTADECCEHFLSQGVPCSTREVCNRKKEPDGDIVVAGELLDVSENTTDKIAIFHL